MNIKHRLGEYINIVDIRNKDLKVNNLLGISVQKKFIPSIANTIGTDFTKYKIVKKGQFTYIPDTSRRGDKIGIALLEDYDMGIVSNIYTVFEVIDNKKLLPEYLMLWFSRPEFDRYARFKSHGSVREIFDWQQMCNVELVVPDIEKQKKIVDIYRIITDRIALKKRINKNLEEQAQAVFKSWFVDFEQFGGVMPNTITKTPLSNLCSVITKGTTPTTLGKAFTENGINFIKAESILDNHSFDIGKFSHIDEETNSMIKRSIIQAGDIVFTIAGTLGRFAIVDKNIIPANTNQAVAIIRVNKEIISPEYLYSFFIGNWHNDYYKKRVQQAVQANLNLATIKSLPITILNKESMNRYTKIITPIFKKMKMNEIENNHLSAIRDSLLSKLMNGEIDVSKISI